MSISIYKLKRVIQWDSFFRINFSGKQANDKFQYFKDAGNEIFHDHDKHSETPENKDFIVFMFSQTARNNLPF